MTFDESKISAIVSRVVARLQEHGALANPQSAIRNPQSRADRPIQRKYPRPVSPAPDPSPCPSVSSAPSVLKETPPSVGVYPDPDAACRAAQRAQEEFARLGFNKRFEIVAAMRKAALDNLERWSREAAAETGMGRAEDKILKNRCVTLKTPGPEILQRPETFAGSDGATLIRLDPWGVIASIIPCTNSTETVINNGIGMVSAGNAVVFNPHPVAKNVSADAVSVLNRAIAAAGGPRELLCCIADPSIESANALMHHPIVSLVLVTGGGGVVDAAMKSGKRAICAGPGNPPAVVDESADLEHAARALVAGASLDNNVVCTDEKEIIAVDAIADRLKALMLKQACVEVRGADIERLTKLVLVPAGDECRVASDESASACVTRHSSPVTRHAPNRKFIGKNPSVILKELGISAGDDVRLVLVDVDKDHPLVWTEQLMPVLPICRLPDADAAIAHAAAVEAGRRHTASIHSQRLDRITAFVNTMNCSICVANAANYAGLGEGGEGYTSYSIATPTGEGLTTARTFCREHRLAVCNGGLSRF